MFIKTKSIYQIFMLIGLMLNYTIAPAQKKIGLEPEEWANILSKASFNEVNSLGSLTRQLIKTDSIKALRFLNSLESSKNSKGYFFRTYFCMLKADVFFSKFADYDKYRDRRSKALHPIKEQIMKLYADALDAVYHTDNELTIGWVCFYSARRMRHLGETALAVMYSKNGVDLFEKVAYPIEPPVYTDLAELLYQVRENDESISYAKKGILAWKKLNYEKDYKDPYKYKIKALNIIGNCFYTKNQNDSANVYYRQALLLAKENNDRLLVGNILGNMGMILLIQNKFDSAKSLFQIDFVNNNNDSIYNEAANELQRMAKADLMNGKKTQALSEAREAIQLLNLWPDESYLRDTYLTISHIFRALGSYDSTFYYNDHFTVLNDSLEKIVITSSLAISKAKLNDKTSRYSIQNLTNEKQSQLLLRNFIIIGIVFLLVIIFLILNNNLLKEKLKKEKIEQELILAKDQMMVFTKNIIEKTNFIEKLESQVRVRDLNTDHEAIISELSKQTILTEEEWVKFKTLFEKIYPDFFKRLKNKFPEITLAEQRTAALTRLHLNTRQIASILGISNESVYKSRQRLRLRFQIDINTDLEELVTNV